MSRVARPRLFIQLLLPSLASQGRGRHLPPAGAGKVTRVWRFCRSLQRWRLASVSMLRYAGDEALLDANLPFLRESAAKPPVVARARSPSPKGEAEAPGRMRCWKK